MLLRARSEDAAGFCHLEAPDPTVPEREPADQLFAVGARAGPVDPVVPEGLPTLALRSRLWRSRSDRLSRPAMLCCSSRERVAADGSCVVGAGEVVPADESGLVVSDRGEYRKMRGLWPVAGAEDRVWEPQLLAAGGSTRLVDAVSFRRAAKRSASDPRHTLLDSEMPGEEARGSILSILVPPAADGGPAMLPVPIRLPILGLEASDGCGKALVENEFDRSELVLDSNLRKLSEGLRLTGGLEGCDRVVENDLPELKEGLEGREGADLGWEGEDLGWLKDGLGLLRDGLGRLDEGLGWLRDGLGLLRDGLGRLDEGLGWLKDGLGLLKDGLGRLDEELGRLNDGLDRPELPENALCWMLDMRLDIVLCLVVDEDARTPDLSRPSACPPTMGESNVAAVTTATAARDRIILYFHILLLLSSGVRPRSPHTARHMTKSTSASLNSTVFKGLRFFTPFRFAGVRTLFLLY